MIFSDLLYFSGLLYDDGTDKIIIIFKKIQRKEFVFFAPLWCTSVKIAFSWLALLKNRARDTPTLHNSPALFLDPEGGSQKATLVVALLVVGISSPGVKNP